MQYRFKVKIDNGHETFRTVYEEGSDYDAAADKVFARLREEFKNEVAFFDIVDFSRA